MGIDEWAKTRQYLSHDPTIFQGGDVSFDGELHYDPYSGKQKRSPAPRRFGPCACGCMGLAVVVGAAACLLIGTLLGFGANEAINNRDDTLATELAMALTKTALARPPATEVVINPPTLPPSSTPTPTQTATVTPLPSQTMRPTQAPPTATPTLTAVPRTIVAPENGDNSQIPKGRVIWSGDLIAVAGGDTIRLLDANAFGQDGITLNTISDIQDIAMNTDGTLLAAAGADGTVIVWDVRNPNNPERLGKLSASTGPVWSVTFDPQDRWLAAGTDDGTIRLWRVQDQAQISTTSVQDGPIFALAFDADGNRLAAGGNQQISLLDVQPDGSLALSRTMSMMGEAWQAAYSPNGVYLALATSELEVWKLATNERIALEGHQRRINCVTVSDDGILLVSGGMDHTARLWIMTDVEVSAWHILVHRSPVVSVAINENGTQLITLTQDNTLRVWDVATGASLETRQL